jgi:hypothetical protein
VGSRREAAGAEWRRERGQTDDRLLRLAGPTGCSGWQDRPAAPTGGTGWQDRSAAPVSNGSCGGAWGSAFGARSLARRGLLQAPSSAKAGRTSERGGVRRAARIKGLNCLSPRLSKRPIKRPTERAGRWPDIDHSGRQDVNNGLSKI